MQRHKSPRSKALITNHSIARTFVSNKCVKTHLVSSRAARFKLILVPSKTDDLSKENALYYYVNAVRIYVTRH